MWKESIAFMLAAAALLGSPGPGITALVAIGRSRPRAAALKFYGAMQFGLAAAAGLSALGLASVLLVSPFVQTALMIVGTVYLLWLAWTIALAPANGTSIGGDDTANGSQTGAIWLGLANPKAYLAFASLFGSFTLLPGEMGWGDSALKWALCVAVMIIVDFAWLALGMIFGRVKLSQVQERAFNVFMGATIVIACISTWL